MPETNQQQHKARDNSGEKAQGTGSKEKHVEGDSKKPPTFIDVHRPWSNGGDDPHGAQMQQAHAITGSLALQRWYAEPTHHQTYQAIGAVAAGSAMNEEEKTRDTEANSVGAVVGSDDPGSGYARRQV